MTANHDSKRSPGHKDHVIVYYDGACPSCVRDRCNYERLAGKRGDEVAWVDITGRDEELRQLGIDPRRALTELHLRDTAGQIHAEMDAYIILMKKTRALRPLAWLIGLPLVRPLVSRLYHRQVERRLRRQGRL